MHALKNDFCCFINKFRFQSECFDDNNKIKHGKLVIFLYNTPKPNFSQWYPETEVLENYKTKRVKLTK